MESTSKPYYSTGFLITIFISTGILFLISVVYSNVIFDQGTKIINTIGPEFFIFVLGGFIAQMIDGGE